MFFSGETVSREEENAQRERAGAHDLATGMARAAAERRSRSGNGAGRRSATTSSSDSPSSSPSPTTKEEAEKTADSPARTTTASRATKGTSSSGAKQSTAVVPKTSGTKATGSKTSGAKAAGSRTAESKASSTKAAGTKTAQTKTAKTATPSTPSTSSSASKDAAPKSSSTKRAGAAKDAAPSVADTEAEEPGTTAAPPAAVTSTSPVSAPAAAETAKAEGASTATETSTSDSADATENSPVVDVEEVTPTAARTEPADDTPAPAETGGESPAGNKESHAAEPEAVTRAPAADAAPEQNAPHDRGLVSVPGAEFAEIPIHEVRENPRNPRTMFDDDELDELSHSLREVGVLQPVVVRPIAVTDDGESFELVMGERRWRAARRAGLLSIPAIIRETSDDDLLRDALLENLHRTQLNPLEEANAYQQLLEDFGCTQDELGDRIGRSRPQITNTLRLLRLPALVQRRLASGAISAGHARALLSLDDPRMMEELAQRIVQEGLSVRAVERLVARGGQQPATRTARRSTYDPHVVDLTSRLSNRLEAPVRIDVGKRKGRVTLEFTNLQDLERLVENMGLDAALPPGEHTDES
ncbi:MAG: ParB/RepB/Spo0J family partition protein [Brachybacterium sp.]|nr:ParB/RepB/Spo0J family partition protein [Brachybacterium sp.]MDN6398919.1 ParB/RepB/Spo0J family partition protein [Brachybacterium sp.]